MNKQDILDLYNGLQAVSNLPGAKWAYAVARNITKLRPEIEALQKAFTAGKEFLDYNKKRMDLAKKYAVKVDGKPKTIKVGSTEEYLIDDEAKFNRELDKLKKKYKKAIEERQKEVDDFNEILKEEIEIDLYMINSDYIPEGITPAQVSAIMPVIDEGKA